MRGTIYSRPLISHKSSLLQDSEDTKEKDPILEMNFAIELKLSPILVVSTMKPFDLCTTHALWYSYLCAEHY